MTAMDNKSATLQDIAKAAGISVASVSKVLNNRPGVSTESRRRVLDIAEGLGYLGRAGKSNRSSINQVTILTLSRYLSESQFYEDVFQGIVEAAQTQSLDISVRLVPSDGPEIEVDVADILHNHPPSSILLLGLDQPDILDQAAESGVPAIIVNGLDPMMRLSSISPDNRFAGWLATRHLLDAGHREIVYVTLPLRLSLRRRLDGFKDALEGAGIVFDPNRHVIDLGKEKIADFETRTAIDRAFESGRLDDTTAFFCSTDVIALGVLQSLEARGLSVPSDYSVIGFDDITIALHSRPPLTTMRIDRAGLGREGIAMLIDKILNPNTSTRRVATAVQFIERATVGPPRPSEKLPRQRR